MAAPFEIVASPYDMYIAPLGAPFPRVDLAPASAPASAAWTLVGTRGAKSQSDAGCTVTSSQTIGEFTGAGSTVVSKRWRQAEGLTVAITIADVSAQQYSMAMDAALASTAPATGNPGTSQFEFYRGVQVAAYSLIVRGISPFNDSMVAQYEVPGVHQMGNPAPNYGKQNPAELQIEYHAYEIVLGSICVWRGQNALHL